ncbi:hypothetical protein [Methanobacterium sp.]|uniref:hypothetical protein n=1 Tax=Methanobacterium sp. TaxID=2164 RepID=UPI0025D1936E|nr:hypothetical protein [Methanobacterium sp.]MBI5459868.1 hypothetical protein [Methanobacterium sp.]
MQVDVDFLEKSDQDWKVRMKVILTKDELSRIDHDALKEVEDFQIEIKDDILYFKSFLSIAEPWEDEPLEELLKATKLEVEYWMRKLLNEEIVK